MSSPSDTTEQPVVQQTLASPLAGTSPAALRHPDLFDLTRGWDLFHDASGVPYASFSRDGHWENWPLNSSAISDYLTHGFLRTTKRAPDDRKLNELTRTLAARARLDGPERKIARRVAGHEDAIYVDLCDPLWRTVRVDADGWTVCDCSPVRFIRSPGMLALPEPSRGGNLNELRGFINVESDDDWILLLAWLVAAFRPTGPYPVLLMYGGEGTAKSTTTRMLRALVDPNEAALRSLPRDERDLAIAGTKSWVMTFDNVSKLQAWQSDALCRIATGAGFGTRRLFTDDEEARFSVQRPILVNGIVPFAEREDFLSRAIAVTLPRISDGNRRSENELSTAFEAARQPILGALLDAVAIALRTLPHLQPRKLPRMADFAKWGMAAEAGLGCRPGAFIEAYERNLNAGAYELLNSDSFVSVLHELLKDECEWSGTPNDLLSAMKALRYPETAPAGWPKSPRQLTADLQRRSTILRLVGIQIDRPSRRHGGRLLVVRRRPCTEELQSQSRAEVA